MWYARALQFLETCGPPCQVFGETEIFKFSLGDGVCLISGLYRFSFGQETWHKYINKYTNTYTSEIRNILHRLLASRGFWQFEVNTMRAFYLLV